jgi:probable HAF family extracellular repeat protein
VGQSNLAGDTLHQAFLWRNGVMKNLGSLPGLPTSVSNSVNNNEMVVGFSQNVNGDDDSSVAWVWQAGVMTNLNDLIALLQNGIRSGVLRTNRFATSFISGSWREVSSYRRSQASEERSVAFTAKLCKVDFCQRRRNKPKPVARALLRSHRHMKVHRSLEEITGELVHGIAEP